MENCADQGASASRDVYVNPHTARYGTLISASTGSSTHMRAKQYKLHFTGQKQRKGGQREVGQASALRWRSRFSFVTSCARSSSSSLRISGVMISLQSCPSRRRTSSSTRTSSFCGWPAKSHKQASTEGAHTPHRRTATSSKCAFANRPPKTPVHASTMPVLDATAWTQDILGCTTLAPSFHPMSDDPRLGTIRVPAGSGERVAVIGFPFDEGCTRNGE